MYKTTRSISALLWFIVIAGCNGDPVDSIDEGATETAAVTAPDRVLNNGRILTVDEDFSIVEAIALDGDRILATGSNEEMAALANPDTEIMDLEGPHRHSGAHRQSRALHPYRAALASTGANRRRGFSRGGVGHHLGARRRSSGRRVVHGPGWVVGGSIRRPEGWLYA